MKSVYGWLAVLVFALGSVGLKGGQVSNEQQKCVAKAKRFERHGWIYLHIEGEPKERGFQHGYLLAAEIAEGLRVTRASWEHTSAMTWAWLLERAGPMFTPHIDPEDLAELDGMVEG